MDAGLLAGVMPPMSLGGMDRKNRLAGRDNLSNTLPLIPGDRAAFRPKMLKAPPRIDDILISCTFFKTTSALACIKGPAFCCLLNGFNVAAGSVMFRERSQV